MPWREGMDGQRVLYRERLLPRWWVWAASFAFAATLGVAYGFAFGAVVGWLLGAFGVAAASALLVVTAPVVRVDDRVLRVGRARLPVACVGRAVPLDATLSREARSTRLDPRAYLLLRTAASPMSVMVEVVDPDDPHPYWLFTAKHPERVASALARTVEGTREPGLAGPTREAPQ